MAWYAQWFAPVWIVLPVLAFAVAVAVHASARHRLARATRQVEFYRRGTARLEERWAGAGNRGDAFEDKDHLYAADLDLFGEGGLFELLCAARTPMGERRLADWLLVPAERAEIERRHVEIDDLAPRLDLRERIASLEADGAGAIRPEALLKWSRESNTLAHPAIPWLIAALPAGFLAALGYGFASGSWIAALVLLAAEALARYGFAAPTARVLNGASDAYDAAGLRTLAELLRHLEGEPFASPSLRSLQATLTSNGERASAALDRLAWIASLAEASAESLVVRAFLNLPLLFPLHVARRAEHWRRECAPCVEGWLESIARFEALSSLAQYRYERPDDPFPDILAEPDTLDACGLGHPLLPASRCVRNDVKLTAAAPVWLVSGSNMAGKSTLLRAVGLNVVLAMAGAPVRARTLRLSVLNVGASIRINDSLREGQSRFYAEILRLRRIVSLAEGGAPLLFLLDEMLQGTNSNDRRVGAQGLLRTLIELKALGLATTHDLALTQLPALADRVRNVHFGESIEGRQMHFDFKLRQGILTQGNGLELMRALGLHV